MDSGPPDVPLSVHAAYWAGAVAGNALAVGLGVAHALAIHLLMPTAQFESSKPLPWNVPLSAQVVTLLWFPVASAVLLMPKRHPESVDDDPAITP